MAKIDIPGQLHSTATGNVVVATDEILDEIANQRQSEINENTYRKEETEARITARISEEITTPDVSYVSVDNYASLPATGEVDTIYRVAGYDGTNSQVDASKYSIYAWDAGLNGGAGGYRLLAVRSAIDEVFDISAYNLSGDPLAPTTYADLAAAIAGTNVPVGVRKGGMSVKFIRTSDNKYKQARCMAQNFTTDVTQWQGVDDEPTAGSENIVKSGGVYEELDNSVILSKSVLEGKWFAYEMKQGKRYRVINTGTVQVSAWNATAQDISTRVDELCSDLNGGKTGAIITASANTNYIRIGSTTGAASIKIQDLESVKGKLTLINEGKESGVITLKSDGNEFVPFDFVAGHSYRVVNLSDSSTIKITVALDNHTIPAAGEILCDNLAIGNISNAVTVQQNASWVRIGSVQGTAIIAIIDLDVYNGKFEADTFAKSIEVQNLLKSGYLFKGIATPSTVPVVGNYFYIATEPGDYSNFGRGVFGAGNIIILRYYNNAWFAETVNNVTTTINTILPPFEVGSGVVMASDGSIAQTGSGGNYDGNVKYVKVKLISYNKYTNITFKAHTSSIGGGYGFIVYGEWVGYPCPSSNKEITINVPTGATEFRTFWNRNVYSSNDIVCNKPIYAEDIERISKESVPLSNGIVFEPEYDLSKIPVQDPITRTTDVDALYALYDSLVEQYPEYISKKNLSSAIYEAEGLEKPSYLTDNIYAYEFRPKLTGDFYGEVDAALEPIKAMIVTGTHPDEWFNVFTTFRMMKMICENWGTIPDCELVRTRVNLYVVPCLNPWGFRNSTRWNGHFGVNGNPNSGVNLNRNFPSSNWTKDTSSFNNSGSLPGSEYETKVLMYYVNIVKPITFIDYHTPRMDERGHRGVWCGMDGKVYQQLANSVIISTSNQERKEDDNYPGLDTQLYYIVNHLATGEEYQWVAEQGYGFAVLLEGGESNKWVNGVLTDTEVELDTPKLMRENIQYCFNALLKMLDISIKMFM